MAYFERRGIDTRRVEQMDIYNKAYERAEAVLEEERIDPEKFRNYDKDMIRRDQEYVLKREARFNMEATPESEEAKKIATVFEAIIHEQTELSDWLGPEASTVSTSRYDDIANGTDTIVRFQREDEADAHLGLAIDVTFSPDIREKLDDVKEDIKRGKLTEIKYFALPDPENPDEYTSMGRLKVPRVVIGVSKKSVSDLAELWIEKEKRALEKHPVQHVIARETLDQLTIFERYARSRDKSEIAAVYKQVREVLERSLREKEDSVWLEKRDYRRESEAMGALRSDEVFSAITGYMEDMEAMEIRNMER